ncbi:protein OVEREXPRESSOR OF CATIONIC PEROXIDASE 3 [Sesamum angolense]|uniref:Protein OVEREXPRESSOR OF CATIONIC PEROXIDASE 3 n=1 Tax=Sesamum angolense TaxID=2727404 RepID=A0AAE1WY48_9LAMI|nr:protein OVEREXPRESSOR OF CATIONIC PEROXIDASE 3 [Sesamum angolense]
MSSTTLRISISLQSTASKKEPFFLKANPTITLPRFPLLRSTVLSFSTRRRRSATTPSTTSKKINKKKITQENVDKDEEIDEDAFEALFRQLEEDLKNDELYGNEGGDDDISEEELAKLEQELAEALEDDELFGALVTAANEDEEEEDDDVADDKDENEVDDDNEEEEMPIKLKNWQLRRLAYALKNGRRKTSIKNLAAELCLDRAVVLKLLRDPPPNLVMMSATLPDKPVSTLLDPVEKPVETVPLETKTHSTKPEVEVKVPVHVMQSNWSARKRLKKVQVETLEQVYKRTKRPTNAMISSIVHVTNLPRKRVLKWFEDKRAEEGVPELRLPYQRSGPESVFTS